MAVENVVDLKLNFDDNGLVELQKKQLDLIQRQVKYQKEMKDAVNETLQEAVVSEKKYSDAITENLSQLKAQDLQLKKTSKSAELYDKVVDQLSDNFGIFKDQATGAINGLKNYASGLVASARSATGFVKVLKLVRVALISTGIGAIVIALVGLVAAFGRTAAGGEKLAQLFRGLTSTVDVLIGRFATIGNAIIGLFSGTKTLSQATKEAAGAFSGLGKEMKAAFNEGQRIEKMYQQLEKSARQLSIDESQVAKRVAYLQTIAEKEGVSAGKAINAISAARKAEIDITDRKIEQQELLLKATQAENKLAAKNGTLGKEQLDKEAAALTELNALETDRINLAAEYQSQINGIIKADQQEKDRKKQHLKELKDEYDKLIGDLEKRLDKATLGSLDGLDRILAEKDAAILEIIELQSSIENAAKIAGVKIPQAVRDQVAALLSIVDSEFQKAVREYKEKNGIENFELLPGLQDRQRAKELEKIVKENAFNVVNAAGEGAGEALSVFDDIKQKILKALNLNEEQLGFITNQISSTISSLDSIISSGTDRQIAENERLIKSIEDRVRAAEEAYNVELKLQEDGFANSAKLKEDDLRKEQARLAAAQQKKEELEKRALRQQLISDSLQQASQLALGAAKVLTAESGKGLIGIVTAAAGIALLFRIIAQAKANAAKFSTPPKFRRGGQLLEGPSHEQGGIPIVFGNSRVVEAEGGEFIIRKKSSTINEEFFHNVNKGHYDHLNLTKTIEQANQGRELARRFNAMGETGSRIAAQYRARDNSSQNRATDKAISDRLDRLTYVVENVLETLQERPVITPTDTGYRKEYRRGRIKYRETFRPKKD